MPDQSELIVVLLPTPSTCAPELWASPGAETRQETRDGVRYVSIPMSHGERAARILARCTCSPRGRCLDTAKQTAVHQIARDALDHPTRAALARDLVEGEIVIRADIFGTLWPTIRTSTPMPGFAAVAGTAWTWVVEHSRALLGLPPLLPPLPPRWSPPPQWRRWRRR